MLGQIFVSNASFVGYKLLYVTACTGLWRNDAIPVAILLR